MYLKTLFLIFSLSWDVSSDIKGPFSKNNNRDKINYREMKLCKNHKRKCFILSVIYRKRSLWWKYANMFWFQAIITGYTYVVLNVDSIQTHLMKLVNQKFRESCRALQPHLWTLTVYLKQLISLVRITVRGYIFYN